MTKITQANAVWRQHDYKTSAESDVRQWSSNAARKDGFHTQQQAKGIWCYWHKITVNNGERVIVTDLEGKTRTVDGPQRLTLWRCYYHHVVRWSAGPTQYLAIEYKDGTKENVRGPVTLWEDKKRHSVITVLPCITLNANEAMVIYERLTKAEKNPTAHDSSSSSHQITHTEFFNENETQELIQKPSLTSSTPLKSSETSPSLHSYDSLTSSSHRMVASGVRRKIQWGPCLYVPTPQEWVHMFQWGGAGSSGVSSGSAGFSKVNTTPDSLEVQVDFVRTADDGMLDLSLMIYFELLDLEKMLDATQDPITDITNALTSDVILSFSKTTFQKFKASTEVLNDIHTYGETLALAARIGYKIHRVVFKGYRAGDALQAVQDEAIKSRTTLMLGEETERQNQVLYDLKLQKEQERAAKKQQLEIEQIKSELILKKLTLEHEVMEVTEKHNLDVEHLKKLAALGIDLTAYLVAKEQKFQKEKERSEKKQRRN